MHPSRRPCHATRSTVAPELTGLPRVPRERRFLGTSETLPCVRPRGLLRQFAEYPRHEALPRDASSRGEVVRAGRRLGLVLRARADGGGDSRLSSGVAGTSLRVTRLDLPTSRAPGSRAARPSYVGRWSRVVAREFVRGLCVPGRRRWLDVGCGAGALVRAIVEDAEPDAVSGIESVGGVRAARARDRDRRAGRLRGGRRPVPSGGGRLLRRGRLGPRSQLRSGAGKDGGDGASRSPGKHGGGLRVGLRRRDGAMRHFWNAATALDPAAASLDEAARFPICAPEPLRAMTSSPAAQVLLPPALSTAARRYSRSKSSSARVGPIGRGRGGPSPGLAPRGRPRR